MEPYRMMEETITHGDQRLTSELFNQSRGLDILAFTMQKEDTSPRRSNWQPMADGLFFLDANRLVASPHRFRVEDLLPLDEHHQSAECFASLKLTRLTPVSLLWSLWTTQWATLRWCMLGQLLIAGSNVLAPLVVKRVVSAFSGRSVDAASLQWWLGVFFASRLIVVFVDTHTFHSQNHASLRTVAALRSLLFRKAMRRPLHDRSDTDLSNLATHDASSAALVIQQLTKIWVIPIQIATVTYLLYNLLGVASFVGIAVMMMSLYGSYQLAKIMSIAYRRLLAEKDQRTRIVKEAFGGMQHVKLNVWEGHFESKLTSQREKELEQLKSYYYAGAVSQFVQWGSPLLVSTASFTVYTITLGQALTTAKVFGSMVLFNVLRGPMQDLPNIVQSLFQSRVSFQRLVDYLQHRDINRSELKRLPSSSSIAISVEDASFSWNGELPSVLRDLNMKVLRGDLVVISGDVGSGKSAFCSALLGELHRRSGSITIAGAVAFTSQTPWIQQLTFRENVLFGREFDKHKYEAVLYACCLDDDLAVFPLGDLTEIGDRGVNLSGGQKARLALARACYADADVYIFDDPLAAVDLPVQKKIVDRCFCGLLSNKTLIIITHQLQLLESFKVVNLHAQLRQGEMVLEPRQATMERTSCAWSPPPAVLNRSHGIGKSDAISSRIKDEERRGGTVSGVVWSHYFRAVGGMPTLIVLVGTQLLWQAFQVGSDLWIGKSTERGDTAETTLGLYALLAVACATMGLVRGLMVSTMGLRASSTLFKDLVSGLIRAPMRFFDVTPIGHVLTRFSDEFNIIDRSIPTSIGLFLSSAFSIVSSLSTTALSVRWVGLLLMPIAWLYLQLARRFVFVFCELMRIRKICIAPILTFITQSERGVQTLRAFGDRDLARAIREMEMRIDTNSRLWHTEIVLVQWFIQRLQLLGCGLLFVVLGSLYWFRDLLSAATVGLVFSYTLSVNSGLTTLIRVWARSENAMVSVESVLQYSLLEPEGSTQATETVPATWPSTGRLVFDGVRFGYTRNKKEPNDDLALRDVSFSIAGGEKVGIIGRTGSGKSSLVMALFRINELRGGRILIDDVDIARIPLPILRQQIAIIPQTPILLEGSLRDFLDPYRNYSDGELIDALERVQLLQRLRDLCQASFVGEVLSLELRADGDNLSVGQRQLLCMARVLLRKTKIVILDEATASVDDSTERSLAQILESRLVGATVLTIAHRLSTVRHASRILELEHGRVKRFDTPDKVLAVHDGDLSVEPSSTCA